MTTRRAGRRLCSVAGFSLVELATVLVLASLLASAVWPSWRAQLLRSRRVDATGALEAIARAQERYHEVYGVYAGRLEQLAGVSGVSGATGRTTRGGYYRISLVLSGPQDYVAAAQAQAAQVGDEGCERIALSMRGMVSEQQPNARCWLP